MSEEKKQRFSHGLAGIIILVKAYDKLEHGHAGPAMVIALCGLLFLAYAALHGWLHQFAFHRHLNTAAFAVEAVVMGTISYAYFHAGKHGLPLCYAAVAMAYVVLALRQHRRNTTRSGYAEPHQH